MKHTTYFWFLCSDGLGLQRNFLGKREAMCNIPSSPAPISRTNFPPILIRRCGYSKVPELWHFPEAKTERDLYVLFY